MEPVTLTTPCAESRNRPAGMPRRRFRMREFTILMSVILAVILFGALNRQFLDVETVVTILENAAPEGLVVMGMAFVIICGACDMSVAAGWGVGVLGGALAMTRAP